MKLSVCVNNICGIIMTQILFTIFVGGYTYILAILPAKVIIKILLFIKQKKKIEKNIGYDK